MNPHILVIYLMYSVCIYSVERSQYTEETTWSKLYFLYLFIALSTSFLLYRCRCGHCQSLTPDWKKAATALKVNTSPMLFYYCFSFIYCKKMYFRLII